MEYFDFEYDMEVFCDSWLKVMEKFEFVVILCLLFYYIVIVECVYDFVYKGVNCFYKLMEEKFG